MPSLKNGLLLYMAIFIVVLSITSPEVEGRRLVLRGRRTITRTYYRPPLLPAWAFIVLIAVVQLVLGLVLYFVLRKVVLSSSVETENTYRPAMIEDDA